MRYILLLGLLLVGAVQASPWVTLKTTVGNIVLELDEDHAPESVRNFLGYAKSHFYNGTIFHRVIPGFVVQGGGYDTVLHKRPPRAPITNESYNGLKNDRGTIAMARTQAPHSATSQFFINLRDNVFLNRGVRDQYGYAVFGKVVQGMNVVDAISKTPTGAKGPFTKDVPLTPIIIQSVDISDTNPIQP